MYGRDKTNRHEKQLVVTMKYSQVELYTSSFFVVYRVLRCYESSFNVFLFVMSSCSYIVCSCSCVMCFVCHVVLFKVVVCSCTVSVGTILFLW